MQRFIVLLVLGLLTLPLSFKAVALDIDFSKDNLDNWTTVGGEWKLKNDVLVGTTTGRIWGVCFRYENTSTNYRLNLYEDLDGANNLYIYKRVSGNFSKVTKVPVGQIDKNTWYTLKLSITGNSIEHQPTSHLWGCRRTWLGTAFDTHRWS